MDLNYGAEYNDFRKEVQDFCKEYQGVSFISETSEMTTSDALSGSTLNDNAAKKVTLSLIHI